MRVLITNNTLAERAGSELYVRDLAVALVRRGHQPVAYSNRLGEVAEELRAATVPVIDDLAKLTVSPDIIHGQHHLDAMTAMLRFPGVPAVYFCHGWLPWEEMAPRFPAIQFYVAIDDLCVERLECVHGIPPGQIRVIRNFVDLQRFPLRSELPVRPRRALAFSNYMPESGLEILRRACSAREIKLDAVGASTGQVAARPGRLLGEYDIVFGKGRCALEAMVAGTAVVVCDAAGLGNMVTPENYEGMRRWNFGIRCLGRPITTEGVAEELDRYDAGQARVVSLRARSEAGLDDAVEQIIAVYQEAIASYRETSLSKDALLRDASDYLRSIAEFIKARYQLDHQRLLAEADAAGQNLRAQQAELALREAQSALQAAQSEVERQIQRVDRSEAARLQLEHQSAALQRKVLEREIELAAIHGSRLWPVMTRIQRFRRFVRNRPPQS
jgi:hypothetical protein